MRLAHCSDLHLLSLDGAKVLDFANKRWIGGMNLIMNRGRHHKSEIFESMVEDLNAQKVDQILVTGDITNLALDEEFRFARTLFDRLELGPEDVTVLPGNHDAYVQAGAAYFANHFGDFYASDEEYRHESGAEWPSIRRRGPVALFSLSTSLQTPWFTAYGVIGDEQLDRLRAALADPRFDDALRLVSIHHSPLEPRARSRIRGLKDRAKFYQLLEDAGAELVLHGHEHVDLTGQLPGPMGPIPVRGVVSGTYDAGDAAAHKRARYRIFEVSDTCEPGSRPQVVSETVRAWDPQRGCFGEEPSKSADSGVSASV